MEAEQTPTTPSKVVFERIKQLRAKRGISGAAVAQRMTELGIPWDRNTVAKIETGRRASLTVDELVALAHVLDASPLVLLLPRDPVDYSLAPNLKADVFDVYRWILGQGSRPEPGVEGPRALTAAEEEEAAWLAFKQQFLWLPGEATDLRAARLLEKLRDSEASTAEQAQTLMRVLAEDLGRKERELARLRALWVHSVARFGDEHPLTKEEEELADQLIDEVVANEERRQRAQEGQ